MTNIDKTIAALDRAIRDLAAAAADSRSGSINSMRASADVPPLRALRDALAAEPRAWAAFASNGNCRIWFGDRASAERWNERYNTPGAELSPLYEFGSAPLVAVKESLTVDGQTIGTIP